MSAILEPAKQFFEACETGLIAQASLGSVTLVSLAAFDEAFTDTAVASNYVKMIQDPNAMTTEEMAQANQRHRGLSCYTQIKCYATFQCLHL
jgi:hypothetical protein